MSTKKDIKIKELLIVIHNAFHLIIFIVLLKLIILSLFIRESYLNIKYY